MIYEEFKLLPPTPPVCHTLTPSFREQPK